MSTTTAAVKLPAAVARQGREADEAMEQLRAPAQADTHEKETTDEGASEAPQAADTRDGPPQGKETPKPEHPNWELAYKTLKGKYDSEVPRLAKEVRELKASLEKARAEPVNSNESVLDMFTAEERESFDEDMLKLLARVARHPKAETPTSEPAAEPRPTPTHDFMAVVKDAIPNAWEVNADPAFRSWIEHPDPVSGYVRTYDDTLQAAQQAQDPEPIIRVFQTFLRTGGQDRQTERQNQLARKQTVPAEGGGSPPEPGDQRVFKASEIKKFYDDLALGRLKRRLSEKEIKKMERRFEVAQREGRIVNG